MTKVSATHAPRQPEQSGHGRTRRRWLRSLPPCSEPFGRARTMVVLRWLVRIVVFVVVLIALGFVAASFHDGPLGPIPGGALVRGELVTAPVTDWSFADVPEIELQLATQSRSRTTWIIV